MCNRNRAKFISTLNAFKNPWNINEDGPTDSKKEANDKNG